MKGCLIAFLLLFTAVIESNAQKKLSIQGFLKDGNGKAVDNGNYELTFKIYDVATGGTALWTESRPTVKVFGGVYSVNLGEVTSLDLLPFDKPYFVGITVANTEFTPRIELTYAPYALSVAGISGYNGSAKFASDGSFSVAGVGSTMALGSGALNVTSGSAQITTPNSSLNFAANGNLTIAAKTTQLNSTGDISFKTGINGKVSIDVNKSFSINDSTSASKFYIDPKNGRVGIGTDNPQTGLHIAGTSRQFTAYGGVNASSYSGFVNIGNPSTPNTLLLVDGEISCKQNLYVFGGFTFSDKRFKNIIGLSNTNDDLHTLNKIKITDYEYIDKVSKNGGLQKKVIAQELEKVMPTAVSKKRSVVPSIYQNAKQISYTDGVLTITTEKAHELVKNDEVDIITPKENLTASKVIEVVDEHTFKINTDEKPEGAFVYGKWVNDARAVDYEAIAMLNVSATQELHKQIKALQAENSTLREQNKKLIDVTAKIESRLEKLENTSNYQSVSKTAATEDK